MSDYPDRATCVTMLNGWITAEQRVQAGQSYSVGGQTVTYADMATIREQITYWTQQIRAYDADAVGLDAIQARTPKWA